MISNQRLCFSIKEIKPTLVLTKSGPGAHHACKVRLLCKKDMHIFKRMELAVMEFQPGGYTEAGSHPHREQAYYVFRGKASVKVGDEQYIASKGDVVLIPCNKVHSYKVIGKEPFEFMIIDVEL